MKAILNQARWDRVLRIALGLALLAVGWSQLVGGVWDVAFDLFGWIPLLTGIVGWCPIYALAGVSSVRRYHQR